jgi:tetratricopeptide (TPR) repeat protein
LDVWAREAFEQYDPQNPAASYGQVIDQLFFQSEERQREIESLCDGRFPGFGYAVLSGMVTLEAGRFNVVLTTNFDDLIADALYLFTTARPLVIHHESLASYIRPTRTRPLIVKLHGDHRLSPQNTARETASVKDEIEANVRTLLHDRGLVFIGYGGNDKGIQKMFEALPAEALPLGVFWVASSEPEGIIRPWLEARNAVWVQKGDFDECMLVLRDEFQIQHPERKRFDDVFEKYAETYKALSSRINSLPDTSPEVSVLKEVVRRTDQSFPDWRAASLEAERFAKTDPDQAETIFKRGIEQFPQSGRLLADFAAFVRKFRRDQKAALELYERAVELSENDPWVLSSFAVFLSLFTEDYDRADSVFRKLLDQEPDINLNLTLYADFLAENRGNYDEAEKLYERAVTSDPNDAFTLSSFGRFMHRDRKNLDRAEELHRRATVAAPSGAYCLAAFGDFLILARQDLEQAELYFQRAVQADHENSYALGAYAKFLTDHRNDYNKAEELFLGAIEADPLDAQQIVSFAEFLRNSRQDSDRAEEQFSRALSLSPNEPAVLTPYISFLREIRKDETEPRSWSNAYTHLAETFDGPSSHRAKLQGFNFSTDFHNSFESYPSRKPFPSANLNPTVARSNSHRHSAVKITRQCARSVRAACSRYAQCTHSREARAPKSIRLGTHNNDCDSSPCHIRLVRKSFVHR